MNIIRAITVGWKVILICLIITLAGAVKYNCYKPETYKADALIAWQSTRLPAIVSFSNKNSEIKKSGLIDSALKGKKFNVEYYQAQPLLKKEIFTHLPFTVNYKIKRSDFYKKEFHVKYADAGTYIISYNYKGIERERTGYFGKEFHEAELNFTILKNNINKESNKYQFIIYSDAALAEHLEKNSLRINSENGHTIISAVNNNPEKAKILANAVSVELLEEQNDTLALSNTNVQISAAAAKIKSAQKDLEEFKLSNNIYDLSLQTESKLRQVEMLQSQKLDYMLESVSLNNLSSYFRTNRKSGNALASFGSLNDPVFTHYLSELNKAQKIQTPSAEQHQEINDIQNLIAEGLRNNRKNIALQIDEINKMIAGTYSSCSKMIKNEGALHSLKRELDIAERNYQNLLEKKSEITFVQSLQTPAGTFQEAKSAMPLKIPAPYVWLLALFAGILTGIAALIIHHKYKSFFSAHLNPEKLTKLPCLGTYQTNSQENKSQVEEICGKLLIMRSGSEKTVITVSLPESNEKNSALTVDIAKTLASLDLKVLILDLSGKFSTCLNVIPSAYLSECLENKTGIQEASMQTAIPNLDIISGGVIENNLIMIHKASAVLNDLKKQYDCIIINTDGNKISLNALAYLKISDVNLLAVNAHPSVKNRLKEFELQAGEYHIKNNFMIILKDVNNNFKAEAIRGNHNLALPLWKKAAMWFY